MQNWDDILQKEVSRKEFLRYLGVALASVMGLSTILKLTGHKGLSALSSARGYGSSPYGR